MKQGIVLNILIILALSVLAPAAVSGQPAAHAPETALPEGAAPALGSGPTAPRGEFSRLEEYLAYALERHPGVQAAYQSYRALAERPGYAGSLPDPVVSYGYFGEPVQTRVGPQEHRVSLRQSIPWFGILSARKAVASREADAARQRYRAERLRVVYEIESAYYEYYYLGRELVVTRENLELLRFWESITQTRYRLALADHPDLIRIQVELGKLENDLRTLEDRIAPVTARLRSATGLPDTIPLPVPETIPIVESELNRESIIADARRNNPDLRALLHTIEREEAGVRLAGGSARPGFVVGFDYIQTGPALDPAMPGSGTDPWMVSVGVTLPVWFGANGAREREAEANKRSAEYAYTDARNRLTALAERFIFTCRDALRQMRLYRDGLIPKAEQSLNASFTAYQAGEAGVLDLLDSQRQLLELQLQFERSKRDLAVSRAAIDMLTGKESDRS